MDVQKQLPASTQSVSIDEFASLFDSQGEHLESTLRGLNISSAERRDGIEYVFEKSWEAYQQKRLDPFSMDCFMVERIREYFEITTDPHIGISSAEVDQILEMKRLIAQESPTTQRPNRKY